jgi:drug/metabolite transporter (DMT)-like permease
MATRSIAGGIILMALSWREIANVSARAWANAAGCGLLFFLGCHGVLAYAQQTVPSGIAAIMLATIPFWVVLLELVLPAARRPSPGTLIALVPGFAGVALIALQNVSDRSIGATAIALLLFSALSWAAGSLLSKRTSSDASSLSLAAIQLTAGGAALLLTSLSIGEFREFSPGAVTAPSAAALIYLIVAGSVLGFAAYHWLLDTVPTTQVTTYTFVNPVVAVILGWFFLQESLPPAMLIGGLMVVGSVVTVWRAESRASADIEQGRPIMSSASSPAPSHTPPAAAPPRPARSSSASSRRDGSRAIRP